MIKWADVEAQLTHRCGRVVQVYSHEILRDPPPRLITEIVSTALDKSGTSAASESDGWNLYLEIIYAQCVRISARMSVQVDNDVLICNVHSISSFITQHTKRFDISENEELLAPSHLEKRMRKRYESKQLLRQNESEVISDATIVGLMVALLESVVSDLHANFHALQVKTLLGLADAQRAKFEYELLQHHKPLEVLLLATSSEEQYEGRVIFVLPLFEEEEPSWDVSVVTSIDIDPEEVYLPMAFNRPNFLRVEDRIIVCAEYPLGNNDGKHDRGQRWSLTVQWPRSMLLSSQVTHIPPSTKPYSSVEILSTCRQSLLSQWRRRSDFIQHLRQKVIVLEYDAFDFSRFVFMLQDYQTVDHSHAQSLRIVILLVTFTAPFFLTNCFGDLRVTLLDGNIKPSQESISIYLPSSPNEDITNLSLEMVVTAFLQSVKQGLAQHLG